jgi:peptidoglycan hydrolase CwlO-like protein
MMFRNMTRVMMLLAATSVLAQSTPPASVPGGGPIAVPRRGLPGRAGVNASQNPAALQGTVALRQRVDDMQSTLTQMHDVLKKMQARQAKNTVKDPLTKANLEMWGLMVGHLDKELQELHVALAQREDMESRRAALYKQADAKAEAEAQAARAAMAAKFAGQPATATPAQPAPASTAAPASSAPTPSSPAATSAPTTPATSPN